MAITPQQPTASRPIPTQPIQRVALEQLDVKNLSKDKIRELFRVGKLPTADQIVEEIILRAVQSGANEIHFEPIGNDMQIRFGHEGTLKRLVSLSADMGEPILNVLKAKSSLNQFEKKKPQEG
jgi:type IV pilus assembly protein PilB